MPDAAGRRVEATFLNSFGGVGFQVAELEDQDIRRMAELVEAYLDLPLGIADAAVIVIAERIQLTEITTPAGLRQDGGLSAEAGPCSLCPLLQPGSVIPCRC